MSLRYSSCFCQEDFASYKKDCRRSECLPRVKSRLLIIPLKQDHTRLRHEKYQCLVLVWAWTSINCGLEYSTIALLYSWQPIACALSFSNNVMGSTTSMVSVSIFCHYHLPQHMPLARYEKLRVAHAPGMPGTFSPLPRVSDPDMHQGTCVTHVP